MSRENVKRELEYVYCTVHTLHVDYATYIGDFFVIFLAAWVHRGFSDDVTEVRTIQPGGDLLTDFQKDKFRYVLPQRRLMWFLKVRNAIKVICGRNAFCITIFFYPTRYFFFHVLDLNSDYVISAEDFDRLNEVSAVLF